VEKKGSSKALTYQTHPKKKGKKDFQLTGKITKARGKGPSRHNTVNCNKCSNMQSKQKPCKSLHGQRRTKRNVIENQEGCTDCRQADHQGLFRLPFRTTMPPILTRQHEERNRSDNTRPRTLREPWHKDKKKKFQASAQREQKILASRASV